MMSGEEEPVGSAAEPTIDGDDGVAAEIVISGVNAKLGKEDKNGKVKRFRKFTFSFNIVSKAGTVLATHLLSKRFSEFCEDHEHLSRKKLWRTVAPPSMPPKYPLKDMVSDKANVQKRFNELKRYFTRVFNDPADTGDLILNPILSQVYKMEDEFVALLPKVAAARKELGKEWTSRKTVSVRGGSVQAMKSADARQAAFASAI
mmetsp:Transcript_3827/g.5615  ORF Transcript_3827/g.5615 Transcript_3827/m.5615 type:complete len:203 (+) Transcript_3827:59-667(+)|eukprot:CAMPEP_0195526098 /NCGR_PEP_ID=MMETSP0794_2-20130614/26973_1 /TAXON_ID=515487 /ORGANISM="Stephanopyxis turris, Strain CCMP 815" /LENGTH=202 /DNA_ID=CAMNT_0040656715 /DNA_START=57 /DNA_END=665 /DNA_ORIENTATION=-